MLDANSKKNLSQATTSPKEATTSLLESSECLGAETLLQLLKNYSRNLNLKTAITVGIIGYPNVGKSSLINSLKRTRAVGVGATPGFTKTVQEIHLDKNIKLLDCPGIVFGNSNNSDNDIILRNCVKVEQIPDAIEPVETILKRCKKEQLLQIYMIPDFSSVTEFLIHIAGKRGKLGKGGKPELNAAAKTILQDWNGGKIPFFTEPPKIKNVHLSASIVAEWGTAFDIDSVFKHEQASIISRLPDMDTNNHMSLVPGAMEEENEMLDDEMEENEENKAEEEDSEEEAEAMEDEDEPPLALQKPPKQPEKKISLRDEEDKFNPQVNQNMKKQLKKQKKVAKKRGEAVMTDEAYDFGEFFAASDEPTKDGDYDLQLADI